MRVFPELVVDLSKPGAGTAPIALPQDQGVALEDPQPASRVQDSATNEICSWQLDANGSFFGVFDPPPKGICLIYFHTQSHYYSTISTKGVCLSMFELSPSFKTGKPAGHYHLTQYFQKLRSIHSKIRSVCAPHSRQKGTSYELFKDLWACQWPVLVDQQGSTRAPSYI